MVLYLTWYYTFWYVSERRFSFSYKYLTFYQPLLKCWMNVIKWAHYLFLILNFTCRRNIVYYRYYNIYWTTLIKGYCNTYYRLTINSHKWGRCFVGENKSAKSAILPMAKLLSTIIGQRVTRVLFMTTVFNYHKWNCYITFLWSWILQNNWGFSYE